MGFIKRVLYGIIAGGLVILAPTNVFSQVNFFKYFDKNQIRLLDIDDYPELKFAWTMPGPTQVAMNEGLNAMDSRNWQKAALHFTEVIKDDPSRYLGFFYRGVCNLKQRKLDDAKDDFESSIRYNKKIPESYLELGKIYHVEGKLDKAESRYKKCIELDPNFVVGHYHLGILNQERNKWNEAAQAFHICQSKNPKFAPAFMAEAILVYQQNESIEKSIPYFDKAIVADSSYRQTYFWRGVAWCALNKPEKALPDCSLSIQFYPSNPFMLFLRGSIYVDLKNFDRAFTDFRKAILARAVNENRFVGGQTILDKQIDLQNAATYLIKNGYGLDEEAFLYLKEGFCYLLTGEWPNAMKSLSVSARMEPSACAYYLLGVAYDLANAPGEAIEQYGKALSKDNDIFDAHKKLAIFYQKNGLEKEVNEQFNEMLRIQPESPSVFKLRGIIKSNKTDYVGAISDFSKVLASDSMDADARKMLITCRTKMGDFKGANQDLSWLTKIEPENETLYDLMAKNYLALKDTSKAISIYKSRLKISIQPIIILGLARVYIYQSNDPLAAREFNKLLHAGGRMTLVQMSDLRCMQGILDYNAYAYPTALISLNEAIHFDKTNFEAILYRALTYTMMKKPDLAIADAETLKKANYYGPYKLMRQLPVAKSKE